MHALPGMICQIGRTGPQGHRSVTEEANCHLMGSAPHRGVGLAVARDAVGVDDGLEAAGDLGGGEVRRRHLVRRQRLKDRAHLHPRGGLSTQGTQAGSSTCTRSSACQSTADLDASLPALPHRRIPIAGPRKICVPRKQWATGMGGKQRLIACTHTVVWILGDCKPRGRAPRRRWCARPRAGPPARAPWR